MRTYTIPLHNHCSNSFAQEMVSTILSNNISRDQISQKTGMSIRGIRKITMGEDVLLTYGHFRKLLYLYCWTLEQSKYAQLNYNQYL